MLVHWPPEADAAEQQGPVVAWFVGAGVPHRFSRFVSEVDAAAKHPVQRTNARVEALVRDEVGDRRAVPQKHLRRVALILRGDDCSSHAVRHPLELLRVLVERHQSRLLHVRALPRLREGHVDDATRRSSSAGLRGAPQRPRPLLLRVRRGHAQ
eukprot:7384814-Prymnesium_polylepis.1